MRQIIINIRPSENLPCITYGSCGKVKAIEKEVTSHVRDGDVVLLHNMSDSSAEAALKIVDKLQEQGFRFVTASELARVRNIALIPGTKYARFYETDSQERK